MSKLKNLFPRNKEMPGTSHGESAAVAGLDLAALSREGNLAHLGFLSPLALQVIESAAGHAPATTNLLRSLPPLLAELRSEYIAGAAPA